MTAPDGRLTCPWYATDDGLIKAQLASDPDPTDPVILRGSDPDYAVVAAAQHNYLLDIGRDARGLYEDRSQASALRRMLGHRTAVALTEARSANQPAS